MLRYELCNSSFVSMKQDDEHRAPDCFFRTDDQMPFIGENRRVSCGGTPNKYEVCTSPQEEPYSLHNSILSEPCAACYDRICYVIQMAEKRRRPSIYL